MKKKVIAIVIGLLITSNVFATGKMGVGLGYKVFAEKEGVGADLGGWFLNGLVLSQPISMLAGTWGADELPANKQMGVGLGYQVMSGKDATKGTALVGWFLNGLILSQPISMFAGTWGADDPVYAKKSGKVSINLAK